MNVVDRPANQPYPDTSPRHQRWRVLFLLLLLLGMCGMAATLFGQRRSSSPEPEFIPVSLHSILEADYRANPNPARLPGVRLDIIWDVIYDRDPESDDLEARKAALLTGLQTPVPVVTSSACQGRHIIYATQDTWVDSADQAATHGADTRLQIGRTGDETQQVLLYFPFGDTFRPGSFIDNARLELELESAGGQLPPGSIHIFNLSTSFSEMTTNWANRPEPYLPYRSLELPTVNIDSWDVTDIVQDWLLDYHQNAGLMLTSSASSIDFRRIYFSREADSGASRQVSTNTDHPGPRLIIDCGDLPPEPEAVAAVTVSPTPSPLPTVAEQVRPTETASLPISTGTPVPTTVPTQPVPEPTLPAPSPTAAQPSPSPVPPEPTLPPPSPTTPPPTDVPPGDNPVDENPGDDPNPPPRPRISINDVTVAEGDAGNVTATFNVILSAATDREVSVDYTIVGNTATASIDFDGSTGTLTFTPGSTLQTIIVPVLGDTLNESNETFFVNLTNAGGATIEDGRGLGTITDDDPPPSLSIDDVTLVEGNAGTVEATFTVLLSAASGLPVTVDYNAIDGTATTVGDDYLPTAGSLSFPPGIISQTLTVTVIGDTVVEANETVIVNLSGAINATIADNQGLGTILNDDGLTISIADVTVAEGSSGTVDAVFSVSLSTASALSVTVDFATADDSALAGPDYIPIPTATLTFDPGTTTQSITVTVQSDILDELTETFFVNLSNPSSGTILDDQGVGTILDDDSPPALSINDVTVTEGNSGTTDAVFTVSLDAPSGLTVTVDVATANDTAFAGSDYTAVPTTTLTFDPGATTRTITVTVLGDPLDEIDETFFVNLANEANASISDGQGLGTITDDDDPPNLSIDDVTVSEGDSGTTDAVFTVSLDAASSLTVTVDYATADDTATGPTDYITATGSLTFTPGATIRLITIAVQGDALDEPDETFFVNLSNAIGATISDTQGLGIITDDDEEADLAISKTDSSDPVVAGRSLTYTLTITNNSLLSDAQNVVITETLPISVTFNGGTPGWQEITANRVYSYFIGTLISGASQTITIAVTVDSGFSAMLHNTAEVGSTTIDPTPGNNIVTEATTADAQADLQITKSDTADPVTAGELQTYSLIVVNNGPSEAQNIVITDTLPAGVTFFGATGNCAHTGGVVTCTADSQGVGVSNHIEHTIFVTIDISTSGLITNSAAVSSATTDPTPGNNASTVTTTITVPLTLTVNTTDDLDDGTCNTTHCSLREAINTSNILTSITNTIAFSIPGAGPHTIAPTAPLPQVTEPVIIDGTTEPGASCVAWPPNLLIELNGSSAGAATYGLHLRAGNNTVRGLVINRFGGNGIAIDTNGDNLLQCNFIGTDVSGTLAQGNGADGIHVDTDNNTIGGTSPTARNLISGNVGDGLDITGIGATTNLVQGNYIGPDVTGTIDLGNGSPGINIVGEASNNLIGGTIAGAGNLVSANDGPGIRINGSGTSGNIVQGNSIGTDITGINALGNTFSGVRLGAGASNNIIGGATPAARNLISGNGNDGVRITGSGTSSNTVQGNFIGTDTTGTAALGNNSGGVRLRDNATDNLIGGATIEAGNLIAYNDGVGVRSLSGTDNAISSNSIFTNAGLGIDLNDDGVTSNDVGDPDTGSNNLQNFPVVSSATISDSNVIIAGTLNSTANTTFDLQFFANSVCDPSGYGEGETLLVTDTVTTDGSGNTSFNLSVPAPTGQFITATATDPNGNTSEFSACAAMLPALSIDDVTVIEGTGGTTEAIFTVSLSAASAQPVQVEYATANDTALADSDYTAIPTTTLTFNPGVTTQTITVTVLGDLLDEIDETFFVNLANESNATISDGQGIGTIIDDDGLCGAPDLTLTATADTYLRSNQSATNFGSDPDLRTRPLTSNPRNTLIQFDLSSLPSNVVVSCAALLLHQTSSPDTGQYIHVHRVTNSWGEAEATWEDRISGTGWDTAGGDYDATVEATFVPSTTNHVVNVASLTQFWVDNPSANFGLLLAAENNGSNGEIQYTSREVVTPTLRPRLVIEYIPTLLINDVTVTGGESGNTAVVFTVTLSTAGSQTVTVDYATADNTATISDTDYVTATGTLTFTTGITTQPVTVQVVGNTNDELEESFFVNLSNPGNAAILDGQGEGIIQPDISGLSLPGPSNSIYLPLIFK